MKYFVLIFILLTISFGAHAKKNVKVRGYWRSGTFVQPHERSSPNRTKTDNFGKPSSGWKNSLYGIEPGFLRDQDGDGTPNVYDLDDDNDGISDDYD